jgi:O-antigen ligase
MIPLESILILSSGVTVIKGLGIITLGSFTINYILGKERGKIDWRILFPLILFIFWMTLRGLGNFRSVITLFHLFLLFIMTTALCVDNKRRTDYLAWAFIVGCMLSLCIAIPNYLASPEYKIRAHVGDELDPNKYALILGIGFFLFLLNKPWPNSRIFLSIKIISLLAFLYGLIISASRGSVMALSIALIVYFFINKGKLKNFFYLFIIGLVAGTLIVIGLQRGMIKEFSVERIQTLTSDEGIGGRMAIWRAGLKMVNDNFIVGVGLKEFNKNFYKYSRIIPFDTYGIDPHNTYLSILAETGIIGFILAFWIIGAFAYLLRKSKSQTAIIALCLLSFLSVASLSITTQFMKVFWLCLALSYLFINYPVQNKLQQEHIESEEQLIDNTV